MLVRLLVVQQRVEARRGNVVEVTVVGVDWNVSKWGQLKPRVEIQPVKLQGVTITFTTGFNAKFIVDNSIGPGGHN